jgi:protein TonB
MKNSIFSVSIPFLLLCLSLYSFSSYQNQQQIDKDLETAFIQDTIPKNTIEIAEETQERDNEVFMVVEEMPRFPGCEDVENKEERHKCSQTELLKYIYSTLKYPQEARDSRTEGMVVIQFIVDVDGSIIDAKIGRDVQNGCGEAALEVVNSMNELDQKWIPGKVRGKAVKVQYTLPVKFKLE